MAIGVRISLDEWLIRPDTEPSSEFVRGEVLQKPMPELPKFLIAGYLLGTLGVNVKHQNLGYVGPELLCVFGPLAGRRGYVSDIAFVSRERVPRGDARSLLPFRLPPDFVIEVLSPEQNVGRFTEKLQFYLRHGVRLVLVVDPIAETVTVHRPDDDPVTLSAGDILDGADVVPAFTLPVTDIFAQLSLDGEQPEA
jgi:Uma2 family endonuclease